MISTAVLWSLRPQNLLSLCLFLKHSFITHENSLTRRFVNRTVQLFSHHSLSSYSLTSSHYSCTANNNHDYLPYRYVCYLIFCTIGFFRSVSVEIQTLNAVSIIFSSTNLTISMSRLLFSH